MLLTDLHIHSTFSDGKHSIPQIIDLYGQAGFDAIAITDHILETNKVIGKIGIKIGMSLEQSNFNEYMVVLNQEKERALKEYNMVVIPGFELSKNNIRAYKSAHIVALGVDKYISANHDVVTLAEQIHACDGIAIAAHPYFTNRFEPQTLNLWLRRSELKKHIDAWEVGNGSFFDTRVQNSGFPVIANSDFHQMRQFVSYKTMIHARKDQGAILEAICRQKLEIIYYQTGENESLVEVMEGCTV